MDFNFDTGTISSVQELDPGSSNLVVLGTAGVVLPQGDATGRINVAGSLRLNTTTKLIEWFDGTVWSASQSTNATLTSLSNLSGTGFVVQTGANTFAERFILPVSGQTIIGNTSGVSGNVTVGLADAGTAGTYVTVTTDQFGRVTSGNTVQSWSTIVNTPTTLAGYGITDALVGNAGVTGWSAGTLASRPAAGTAGAMYYATDTGATYYDNGSAWSLAEPALTGDVTSAAGGTATTLATVNANVGTFGSTTIIPVITVNAKGLITAVNTATISGSISVTGGDLTLSGSTGTAITNATLATVNSAPGVYGDSTNVSQVTVNGKGLVTAVANVAIPLAVTITGDASGSGSTSAAANITLATVNSNVGSFGSNNQVATFTVNEKGLVTAAGNVSITPASIGAVSTLVLGQPGGVATLNSSGKLEDAQIPAALVGAMQYQGVWDASTNTPALASGVGLAGQYYKVNVAGSTTIDGYNGWTVGDLIVFNGTTWDAIDGLTTEVTSVFGRVGAVTATLASTDFANQGTTTTVLHGNANGAPTWGAISLSSDVTGVLPATSFPALTGDVTTTVGGVATTLATVNSNVGTYGSSLSVPVVTVNGKGLVTGVTTATISNSLSYTGDATGSGTVGSPVALTLANTAVTAGSYGSTTQVGTFTVNSKGLVTAAGNVTIPNTIALTGDATASVTTGGSGTLTLANVNATTGSFGSTTQIPVVTVNEKGLVTNVTTATISGNISVTGGDLTMSGATGTAITNATLATVNSNVGTFGNATIVPRITVNAKGLVTAVANVVINASGTGAVGNAGGAPSIQEDTLAAIPAAGNVGALYITTDTKQIFRDNGTSWDQIGEAGLLYTENPSTPTTSTVSGANAVSIGSGNSATATNVLATGAGASSAVYGAEVRANGSFTAAGDAQSGKYILRNITTTANETEVFLDGSAARIVMPNNSAFTYSAYVVARRTDATNSEAAFKLEGLISRDANAASTSLVGNRSKTVLTRPSNGWNAEVFADTTNGALTFKVTGVAANTIRWVVTVVTSEVMN